MKEPHEPHLSEAFHVGAIGSFVVAHEYSPNPFDTLPNEMIQEIAGHIESDEDLTNIQCSCQSVQVALADPSFWRNRFLKYFDTPRLDSLVKVPSHFKHEYKRRQNVLKYGAKCNDYGRLTKGNKQREKLCLEILRELILDSCRGGTKANIAHLRHFAQNFELVEHIFARGNTYTPAPLGSRRFQDKPNPLLHTIQLVMAPEILAIDRLPYSGNVEICAFPESQRMAYLTAMDRPIFGGCNGLDVDMEWALHQMSFWRYHMLRESEYTLFGAYSALEEAEYPRFWNSPLDNDGDPHIGTNWKGCYAWVQQMDIQTVRMGKNIEDPVPDEFNGEEQGGDFQDLQLTLTDENEQKFNPHFENILRSLEPPVRKFRTRAQKRCASPPPTQTRSRSFRFGGSGQDAEEIFLADGWLNPLPAQNGIPGWQRMTMMKYFEDDAGEIDYNSLWAYEGVCLPGGKIIVGRWWSPNELGIEPYSGPFIMWCVDEQ